MDLPESDGFKWFGEGFDGFPKRLPDDCVEYVIRVLDSSLGESLLRDKLRRIQSAANGLVKALLKDYIWQREAFALELTRDDGTSFLSGRTNYGDSVEDEWLIVYLLRELSRQFPEAWIKVIDTDGEFLLIEAANALPRWLNPERASNRVWMNGGQLLIIPMSELPHEDRIPSSGQGSLSTTEALKYLNGDRSKLLHAHPVEEEAFHRLRNYPDQIAQNQHHALITCPRKLAFILHQNPKCITPIIEAFYLRDSIALRPLQTKNKGHFFFPPEDLVTVRVKFTKVGYAQLKGQNFPVPPVWVNSMPLGSGEMDSRIEMGMKTTCGAEMLIVDPQNQDNRHVRAMKIVIDDIEAGEVPLPSNSEIVDWGTSGDDESWTNIDFQDFENELAGEARAEGRGVWGDRFAQENLRKMVSRFEDFLKDDATEAGSAGSEDIDDDDDSTGQGSSSGENNNKEANFEEDEFTKMMREMMGMPAKTMRELMGTAAERPVSEHDWTCERVGQVESSKELGNADSEEEDEEIRQLTEMMEAELRASGALKLDTLASEIESK